MSWSKKTSIKKELLIRNGSVCRYCGKQIPKIFLEHIIPEKQGGKTNLGNCVLSCVACNSSKCDMSLKEWLKLNIKRKNKLKSAYIYRQNIIKNINELLEERDSG